MDDEDSLGASVYVRDDDNTKVNVAQRRIPVISFIIDRDDPDAHDKVRVVEDKIISTLTSMAFTLTMMRTLLAL